MSLMSYIAAASLALLVGASAALAQQSSLVGTWRTTHPAGPDGPSFVITFTYTPAGAFFYEMAIAPSPGKAGGVVHMEGQYQLTGPNSVQVTYGQTTMCGAVTGCGPAPPAMSPPVGSSKSFDFQLQGANQLISQDGVVYNRIQ